MRLNYKEKSDTLISKAEKIIEELEKKNKQKILVCVQDYSNGGILLPKYTILLYIASTDDKDFVYNKKLNFHSNVSYGKLDKDFDGKIETIEIKYFWEAFRKSKLNKYKVKSI